MRKLWVIAVREYLAAVRTKAFVFSLLLLPLIMGGYIVSQMIQGSFTQHTPFPGDQRYAVVDRTPQRQLVAVLKAAVDARNMASAQATRAQAAQPRFVLEEVEPSANTPEAIFNQRQMLNARVLKGELQGFLDIGPNVFAYKVDAAAAVPFRAVAAPEETDEAASMLYSSRHGDFYDQFSAWAQLAVSEYVRQWRCQDAKVPRELAAALQRDVPLMPMQVREHRTAAPAEVEAPKRPTGIQMTDLAQLQTENIALVTAGVLMVLQFMLISFGSAIQMQNVLEEKTQRIAEVLLGSASAFQLMLGKLLGLVSVSLTTSLVYLASGYGLAVYLGYAKYVSFYLIAWFLFYLVLALLMYGSVFLAIGAGCADSKEAQVLMMPVMMVLMIPLFFLSQVLDNPSGPVAVRVSLIPPVTPMVMLLRQAMPPGVPWWQLALGILFMLTATLIAVWAGGRVFRVGFLMQGKSVGWVEMIKWVWRD